MRSYIRLDPNLPDTKSEYPDGAWRAYVEVLCHSEWQPVRGTFRDERLLRVILGRRARWVAYLLDHRDLVRRADGSLYVVGWAEWNEGDYTAAERMRRYRARKGVTAGVTAPVTPGVTEAGSERVTPPGVEVEVEKEVEGSRRNGPGSGTFMGFRQMDPGASPEERFRREYFQRPARTGEHKGQHDGCAVCEPSRPSWLTYNGMAPEPGGQVTHRPDAKAEG